MVRLASLLILVLASSSGAELALAQSTDVKHVTLAETPVGKEYQSHCLRDGLNCRLVYGEAPSPREWGRWDNSRPPMISGPAATVLVFAILISSVGLWLLFGSGTLLSRAPRDLRQKTVIPEEWRSQADVAQVSPGDLLNGIAAISDQREAMIQLLRHCLLYAANISGTRLARSDTERSALRRLPDSLPGRQLLEELLLETELVHYGGRTLSRDRFAALLDTARGLLAEWPDAHA